MSCVLCPTVIAQMTRRTRLSVSSVHTSYTTIKPFTPRYLFSRESHATTTGLALFTLVVSKGESDATSRITISLFHFLFLDITVVDSRILSPVSLEFFFWIIPRPRYAFTRKCFVLKTLI
jgi:hypothetical protein